MIFIFLEIQNLLLNSMKKILPVFVLISAFYSSQKLSFVYDMKYILNTANPTDTNDEKMLLEIEDNRSIFRAGYEKKSDSIMMTDNTNGRSPVGVEHQYYVKKDLANNKTEKIIRTLGVNYSLPITETLNWKISSEHKKMGKYNAQKAEVSYGGRDWTAWFTTDLPFSDGPYIFRALPGLIISVEDSKKEYSFNLVEVKKLGNIFDFRTKMLPIDWAKYETLAKSYYNDPFDLNKNAGRTVTMTDANGNKMDINEMAREAQKDVINENNPIELNHKINYK